MKQVIVKMQLGSRAHLVKKLEEIELKLGAAYYQHDRVYVPRNYQPNSNYVRLVMRTEVVDAGKTPKYHLILKRHIADSGVTLVNDTIVKDYQEAVQMIHQLGFEKQGEVSRQREALKLAEGSWLYIDKIEGVSGYYGKIENEISDDEKVEAAREDALKTFEILGETNEVKETYADLQRKSN